MIFDPPRCSHLYIARICLRCGPVRERERTELTAAPSPLPAPAASRNWTTNTYVPDWAQPVERRKP